jgi:protein tyrosine/serine phosphatase
MRSFKPLLLTLVFSAAVFAADLPAIHVNNLGKVNGHLLRGAEPSPAAMQELGAAGVKLVIDLRVPGKGTEMEKELAQKLGIRYVNIPLPPLSAPKPEQVGGVLKLITENDSGTVFVHCRRGKDRTGTVIACYRIQHDGWPNDRALEEAKEYGMSAAERGMRAFIAHFTPMTGFAVQP